MVSRVTRTTRVALAVYPIARAYAAAFCAVAATIVFRGPRRQDVYNILWVLVFGFATLNILGLVARRLEPRRSNLQFGEMLAITVTVVSVVLLGWEMLSIFHIFPIKIQPH